MRTLPLAADERRRLVLDALRAMKRAPAWRLSRRTGLGPQAVGAALRGLCARGMVVRAHRSQRGQRHVWWEPT